MEGIFDRNFSASLDCHYLLFKPIAVDARTPLVVTLHGFGADAETMLSLTARLFTKPTVIASIQGPNQFFLPPSTHEVGYGWITSRCPAESIRLHHEMVLRVLADAGREFSIPPERRLLVGFSQSVALNYRFVATYADSIRGVAGICGGLPGDWDAGAYQRVTASVLHISRRGDEHYPPNVTEHYRERLRQRATDVEFHLIDGKHRMPLDGRRIVEPWLDRILA